MFKVVWWSRHHDKTFVPEQYPTHYWRCSTLNDEVVHKTKHFFLNNIQHIFGDVEGCMMKWSSRYSIFSWITSNTCLSIFCIAIFFVWRPFRTVSISISFHFDSFLLSIPITFLATDLKIYFFRNLFPENLIAACFQQVSYHFIIYPDGCVAGSSPPESVT